MQLSRIWKLGVNSFLAHGYYKYQYLMLGKVKMNKAELHVIGVPGIFTNKERYLANMFGFRVFIPVRKTKILTGQRGVLGGWKIDAFADDSGAHFTDGWKHLCGWNGSDGYFCGYCSIA